MYFRTGFVKEKDGWRDVAGVLGAVDIKSSSGLIKVQCWPQSCVDKGRG